MNIKIKFQDETSHKASSFQRADAFLQNIATFNYANENLTVKFNYFPQINKKTQLGRARKIVCVFSKR